jgi:hypothetical protein
VRYVPFFVHGTSNSLSAGYVLIKDSLLDQGQSSRPACNF